MKTFTEFFGTNLKNALTLQAELAVAGKTPEEIQTALGEAFKAEGDKLKFLMNALEAVKGRTEGLKRVIVVTFDEKEKVPSNATKKDDHHYVVEFFPGAPSQEKMRDRGRRDGRDGRGRRGDKRGGKRGGDSRDRRDRRDRSAGSTDGSTAAGGPDSAQGDGEHARRRRPRRSNRPFDAVRADYTVQAAAAQAGSAEGAAPERAGAPAEAGAEGGEQKRGRRRKRKPLPPVLPPIDPETGLPKKIVIKTVDGAVEQANRQMVDEARARAAAAQAAIVESASPVDVAISGTEDGAQS